jgi:hypothetical protein
MPDSIGFTFAQREADQEPDTISGGESFARRQPEPISGRDPLPGYETDPVADREPDSVGDRVPLDGHLPEQPVAVGLDDVRNRHRNLPVGRALGAHAHLDHV